MPNRLPNARNLQALLFDAGNTLVFLDHAAVASVATVHGSALDAEAVVHAEATAKRSYEQLLASGGSHADGWSLFMAELLRHAGADAERVPQLVAAVRAEHDRFNLWRRVPEGLPEALQRARATGLRTGVISNSEGRVKALLDRVGLSPLLDLVVDSGLEGVHKPDPTIFHRTLSRLNMPADAALYAGDIPEVDVQGAEAAGLAAVLIDPFDHYPDYHHAPRVASVVALIDQLL